MTLNKIKELYEKESKTDLVVNDNPYINNTGEL
jgi:hypothetical protein